MTAPEDWPVVDLRTVLELGLERGGHLLTRGERVVVDRMRALPVAAARVHARLLDRRPDVFHLPALAVPGVDDVPAAVAALADAGLVDHVVPWPTRAQSVTRAVLVEAARDLGLRRGGRKTELAERVGAHRGWLVGRWVRLRHTALVERLQRWALLTVHADRRSFVVERLGHARWPAYTPTSGRGLWRGRREWRAWERLRRGAPVDEVLAALARGEHRGPGRLDLGARLAEALLDLAREHERAGRPADARHLYTRLTDLGLVAPARVAFRTARTLEADARPADALAVLRRARRTADAARRIAIDRAGRRLARTRGEGWRPPPPLRTGRIRRLKLTAGERGARPTWSVGGRDLHVEAAVRAVLERRGRQVVRAEGPLWSTLSGLLLAETWFLPVPGALPMRRLAAPLDLGTPGFVSARRHALDAVLARVRDRGGARLVAEAWAARHGERLRGVRWRRWSLEVLTAIAGGLAPDALATILETLARTGPRGCRGLPDLLVLPGEPTRLPQAWPTLVPGDLLLVEVKGPGDALRDAQRAWIDRLLRAGVRVEVWEIRPGQGRASHAP